MEPGTDTNRKGRKARGRVEGNQEKVQQPEKVAVRMDELVRLCIAKKEASENFSSAVKATAEDSGFLAKTVRSFAVAKAGEKFEERKRESSQLSILFDEIP